MRKIIVHTGYVPYDIVRTSKTFAPKSVPAQFIMLTPEINIVNGVNKLLDSMNDEDALNIATNNVIEVYTIRAYIVKHANDYDVEYRYYAKDDYKSDDPSKYQLVKQGVIKASTTFGLFNRIHGGGSGLGIELEKDIQLDESAPIYDLTLAYRDNSYDYSPDAVYGLVRKKFTGEDLSED